MMELPFRKIKIECPGNKNSFVKDIE